MKERRVPLTKALEIVAAEKAAEKQAAILSEAKKVKDIAPTEAKKGKKVAPTEAKKGKKVAPTEAKRVKASSEGIAEAIRAGVATPEFMGGAGGVEGKATVKQLFCYRCGYTWWQKPPGFRLPTRCAACVSPLWNKPRKSKKSK